VAELRNCVQCGTTFEPRREHAPFCSAACRIAWNREHISGQLTGDTALSWSVGAMNDTIERLGKASGIDLPEALALVSESVWWVTLVDATMIRYHEAAYDSALTSLIPVERRATEGTFAGLRLSGTGWATTPTPLTSFSPSQILTAAKLPSPPGRGALSRP
jgi:hypothetical protein